MAFYHCAVKDDSCFRVFRLEISRHSFIHFLLGGPNIYSAKARKHKVNPGNKNSTDCWLSDTKQKYCLSRNPCSPWARRRNPPSLGGILGTYIVLKHSLRVFQIRLFALLKWRCLAVRPHSLCQAKNHRVPTSWCLKVTPKMPRQDT